MRYGEFPFIVFIGPGLPRHRHGRFIKFLEGIKRTAPRRKQIHPILDNYATHKQLKVHQGYAAHRRYHLQFRPTGASWLNPLNDLFAHVTRKRFRRVAFAIQKHPSGSSLWKETQRDTVGWSEV